MSKDLVLAQINFEKIEFNVFEQHLLPFELRGNGVITRKWNGAQDRGISI